MTHAYDKVCLGRASDTLGRMFDYSVYSLHLDIQSMMDLFIASGAASLFEHGDINMIAGMSGVELAYYVMEKSGFAYDRTQPRYTKSLSPEYWCGYALAQIQWETCSTFDHIMKTFSSSGFISGYTAKRTSFLDNLPLNTTETVRAEKIRSFGMGYAADAVSQFIAETDNKSRDRDSACLFLKKMREKSGLSQSGLAKASGIPVRTLQQYEQGQKDLRKARAEYLIALSRVLHCEPQQLLHNYTKK